jgi:protein-S-isoprenylcysteine O-methyltransferase Ste14
MKKLSLIICIESALGLILFASAGRLDLPWIWAILCIHTVMMISLALLMPPDLFKERMRPGGRAVDCGYRRALIVIILASLILIGLDAGRFRWTPAPALWLRVAGVALYVLGLALSAWSMFTNRYFSSVVRVQSDRGHVVVSSGPYAWIRHPGYAGMMLAMLAQCAAVGSAWTLVPAAVAIAVIAARARFEERFLCANLTGYAQYSDRVRWRFAPGV